MKTVFSILPLDSFCLPPNLGVRGCTVSLMTVFGYSMANFTAEKPSMKHLKGEDKKAACRQPQK